MTLTIAVTSKQEILNGSEVLYPWKKVITVVSNRSIVWIWTWKIRKRSIAEKITFDWKYYNIIVEISSKLTSHSEVLSLYIANFFHAVSFYIPWIVFFEPFLYCKEREREREREREKIICYIVENSFLSILVYRCVFLFDISIYYQNYFWYSFLLLEFHFCYFMQ